MNTDFLRAQTPACQNLIHFNNAGASLSPQPVTDALFEHLLLEQRIGGYEAGEVTLDAQENFYHAFGRLLNCNPREIAYIENATRAWTLLLQALPLAHGDRIITGQSEYASNYMTLLHLAKTRDIRIDVIPNNSDGQICLKTLSDRIDEDVRLIALTHVPSQSGVIHPAAEVGKIARKHRIFYLLDACQSAGQIDLNVDDIGCDMLTGSGRKYLRGPRGTGFMYVRQSTQDFLEPPSVDLHSASWTRKDSYTFRDDARRFENWEHFVAGKIALGAAVDYACDLGMPAIEDRTCTLAALLREKLRQLPGVLVHDQGQRLSGIVTFSCDGQDASAVHKALRQHHINTSIARHQTNLLDFSSRNLPDINRASVHYYNTEQEVDTFCQVLSAQR
ncbi:aminotransferase class V-fold PLP-dependent enzyme [Pseudohongiella sp.]|uniref:Aminotransferase class V domain-containing protein n=1 Tax=marine sediment metagenome TaxID=412755 RepID=A0A0F9YLH6_9ZZZZ|nr:aminotransferase class V-fold PLP-dependent enzyme [Pseudohongiella sp.]HDZ10320.1 aminotransferase class V-fold PLP-dependent enzyme [Pseudohongiella sp.]HEA62057.1 aminotransferase class V-fold PLP-dependent enzyme [Pseudohongiella sp.]